MVRNAILLFFFSLTWFQTKTFRMDYAGELSIHMPNVHPVNDETYMCTPMKLEKEDNYIVGFDPKAESKIAHHMLLFGCTSPGLRDNTYNCGAMTTKQPGVPTALNPCGSGSQIIYAWAQNAPNLTLPEGVGFHIGGKSSIKWLVLQVHYASVKYIPEKGDVSGLSIKYTSVPQPKKAGVIYTSTGGRIPGDSITYMEAACSLTDANEIHPFAFRVHTHSLGTVVSGYKVENYGERWTLLGKEDPQLPQMFYEINNNITMNKGDILATRCTMKNHRSRAVWVGTTRNDEMCNFYVMYWVYGKNILNQKYCSSYGPPIYSWEGWFFGGNLKNVPKSASTL